MGKVIGTKNQWTIKEGQFIISKIDARNGAFGVVPHECYGAIATNDFPSFDVDHARITPEFLNLITTTKEFQNICELASTGTTGRRRVDMKKFLDMSIPLPDIATQKRIVSEYYAKIDEANRLEALVIEKEKEIENYLTDTLGITIKNSEKKVGLNFVRFKNLERWDLDYLINSESEIQSIKYPVISYNDIFTSLKNGIAARNYSDNGVRYLLVASIKESGVSDNNIKYVPVESIKESDVLKNGTLLITRKGTVGEACIFRENYPAVASSEIFIIQSNNNVDLDYLVLINQSIFCKIQYQKKATGTIMPSLSQPKLLSIQIPLPPIAKQKAILGVVDEFKLVIYKSKKQSEQLKLLAKADFEKELFS